MKKILICSLLMIFLSGCVYGMTAQRNSNRMLTLDTGLSKQEVLKTMGNPARNERYDINGVATEILFYRTSHNADGFMTDDEFTPMVLENGKLAGWGRSYYDDVIKIRQDINIKTSD